RPLNRRGEPVRVLEVGDPLALEIPYCVRRRLDKPIFSVALYRNDGVCLYGTSTRLDHVAVPPLLGDGVVRFDYRGLPLLAGTYRLSVGVFDGTEEGRPIDLHDKLYSFRVVVTSGEQGSVR